jgi:excinuclease ABC subunit A
MAGRRPAPAASARCKVFSTKRACPSCGTSYPELDPRLFSYNSKHGWCPELRRHRPGADARAAQGARRFPARRRRQGPRAELPVRGARGGGLATALPRLRRRAAEPGGACGALRDRSIARWRAVGGRRRALGRRAGAGRPRGRDRRDVVSRDPQPPRLPARGRPGLPDAGPRRAHALSAARRSASAWPRSSAATCRACATCSTSRPSACTRATTASCSTRWQAGARKRQHAGGGGARRGHHPPRRPRHRHRPRRRPRGGRGGRGHGGRPDAAAPDSVTGRFLAQPLQHPLRPRRAVRENPPRSCALRGANLHNLQRLDVRGAAAAPGA